MATIVNEVCEQTNCTPVLNSIKARKRAIINHLRHKLQITPKWVKVTTVVLTEPRKYGDFKQTYCFETPEGKGELTLTIGDLYWDSYWLDRPITAKTFDFLKGRYNITFKPHPTEEEVQNKKTNQLYWSFWDEDSNGDLIPVVENPPTWDECLARV